VVHRRSPVTAASLRLTEVLVPSAENVARLAKRHVSPRPFVLDAPGLSHRLLNMSQRWLMLSQIWLNSIFPARLSRPARQQPKSTSRPLFRPARTAPRARANLLAQSLHYTLDGWSERRSGREIARHAAREAIRIEAGRGQVPNARREESP
jgi:hypothetical protein